jgi:hypothetical protein
MVWNPRLYHVKICPYSIYSFVRGGLPPPPFRPIALQLDGGFLRGGRRPPLPPSYPRPPVGERGTAPPFFPNLLPVSFFFSSKKRKRGAASIRIFGLDSPVPLPCFAASSNYNKPKVYDDGKGKGRGGLRSWKAAGTGFLRRAGPIIHFVFFELLEKEHNKT